MTCSRNEFWKYNGTAQDGAATLDDSWFDYDDIVHMKSLGYNAVDMHMIWTNYCSNNDGSIPEGFFISHIDKMVDYCEQLDMLVIINWQRFNGTGNINYFTVPSWMWDYGQGRPRPTTWEAYARTLIDFWSMDEPLMDRARSFYLDMLEYTAQRYANREHVCISPRNEPQHFIFRQTTSEAEGQKIVDGYYEIHRQAIDRMNAVGFKGLYMIEVPYGLSNYRWREEDMQDINRDRVVYEYHEYRKPAGGKTFEEWRDHILAFKNDSLAFGYPPYIGEWGVYPGDKGMADSEFLTRHEQMMNLIDDEKLSDAYHGYGRFYGYAATYGDGWTSHQATLYESLQTNRPPYEFPTNGGNGMSFEYKNDDAEAQTYKVMKMQLVEQREVVIQPGETQTITLASDEILVRPDQ